MAKVASVDEARGCLILSRGQRAENATPRIAHLTGAALERASGLARILRPRWVDVTYAGKDDEGLHASAEGWKWLADSLTSIVFLKESPPAERGAKLPDELVGIQTCQYASIGINPRLDAAVRRLGVALLATSRPTRSAS